MTGVAHAGIVLSGITTSGITRSGVALARIESSGVVHAGVRWAAHILATAGGRRPRASGREQPDRRRARRAQPSRADPPE
jgi:hypothetical protein